MKKIGLVSIGSYVPEKVLTNSDLEKMVDTNDEWIVSRTGIRERRIAHDQMHPSDMAVSAAKSCMEKTHKRPQLLISSCGSSERIFPNQSSIVANRLNLENLAAFDINAACSGMVYGMNIASGLIQSGSCETALITASEKMTAFVDYEDRATCVLFGDGASAFMISSEGWEHEILANEWGLDASGSDYVTMGHRYEKPHFWQDGRKVFRFAVTRVTELIGNLKKKVGITDKDPFYVVPHQANLRILQTVAEKNNIPMERMIFNLDRYGNTSSASIGIALEEAKSKNVLKKDDLVFLIAFGAGLTWAGSVIRW